MDHKKMLKISEVCMKFKSDRKQSFSCPYPQIVKYSSNLETSLNFKYSALYVLVFAEYQ
jgi:hypothetical protein